jgi:hypothetical protein
LTALYAGFDSFSVTILTFGGETISGHCTKNIDYFTINGKNIPFTAVAVIYRNP